MTPQYTYTDSPEFIDKLEFAYFETYSLQRGSEFERLDGELESEYEHLALQKERLGKLTMAEDKRLSELHLLFGYTQYLLNDKGEFHYSSKKTSTINSDSVLSDRLRNILRTEVFEIPKWMCAPIYRDAIVFYDGSNQIICTLNVCLSCNYIETKMFNHINADIKTYDLLRAFFLGVGHEVEEDND